MKDYTSTLEGCVAAITPEAARAEIEFLIEAGKRIANAEGMFSVQKIEDHHYAIMRDALGHTTMELIEPVEPMEEPQPDTFVAFSLQGLVDYIKTDVDGIFNDPDIRHIVSVCDVDTVKVYTPITGYHKKRYVVAECRARNPRIPFDQYLHPEDFQIMVQTRFKDSENRKLVLKLAGNIKGEQSMQTADDGVSQKVTVKKGVATAADIIVTNPVELTPLRTFYEVEQPSSPFVLRFSERAEVALFEGDGGAWKLKAVENIRQWLSDALEGYHVEVIA